MTAFEPQDLNRIRRIPQRGQYDRETIYAIVDEAPICHVSFIQDDRAFVIPTIHGRMGDSLFLHGAPASRMLQQIEAGCEICVAVTILDGLVLARSVFHHSMNYRSAILFGRGQIVDEWERKMAALEAVTEHVMAGRWQDARRPNEKEMKATKVVEMPIDLASAKVRAGGPIDDEDDYSLPVWAGVVPIRQQALAPQGDERLGDGLSIPDYVRGYVNNH